MAAGVNIVIGTTGFDDAGKDAIRRAAEKIAVVFSPNMSVGVNATFKLLEMAAKILNEGYDIEIVEAHHRHKVDAPSGHRAEDGRDDRGGARHEAGGRRGATRARVTRASASPERSDSRRCGAVTSSATTRCCFAGVGERIEITHRSSSRATYAAGSMRAARFLAGRRRGLFDMFDVLGIR